MRVDGRAAVLAGLIAGAVFLLLELLLVPLLLGGSAWVPLRRIAAIALGPDVLPAANAAASFDATIVMAAAALHFGLSIVFAVLLAMMLGARGALIIVLGFGAVFGAALYVLDFHVMTAVFPWFAGARHGVTILSHVIFGMVAAFAYAALRRRPVTPAMT